MADSKLVKAIKAAEFTGEDVGERMLAALTPIIAVAGDPDGKIVVGSSKIGGSPDLPGDFEWPDGMDFIAQINFAEIAPHDGKKQLPAQGMLYLFGATDETDLSDPESAARVFFHDGSIKELEGGDDEGEKLRFAASFVLGEDEDGFDSDDEEQFVELLGKSGLLDAELGTMLGPPHFHSEEMDEIFDAKNDITVLHLHGSAIGDIFREGAFQIFADKKAVKKGEIDVYWEGGS